MDDFGTYETIRQVIAAILLIIAVGLVLYAQSVAHWLVRRWSQRARRKRNG